MLRFFARVLFVGSLLFFSALIADAAQDEVFLAKMKVVREINLGGIIEYEVECEGRGRAILKTPPKHLKTGEAINLFVIEGAKEGGKPAYMGLQCGSPRSFKEGFAAARIGGHWSFIDKNGRLLTQRGFEEVRDFNDDFALVKLEKGLAFLGKDGELLSTPMILTLDYMNVSSLSDMRTGFNEGAAIMGSRTTNDKRVVIILDKSGSVVTVVKELPDPRIAFHFTEGLAAVSKWTKTARYGNDSGAFFGYIDKKGEVVIPFEFKGAHPFKEGMAAVSISESANGFADKWGFIDKSGKLVIDIKYDYVQDFSEGMAAVKNGGKWGFIDKEGNIKINITYDEVFPFSEGLAVVKRGGLYGAIDKSGQVVIKFLYHDMKPFVNGLAPAKEGRSYKDKYGYIDKTGKFAIAAQFNDANSFSNGLALVRHDINDVPRYKYINTKGQAALWFYTPRR